MDPKDRIEACTINPAVVVGRSLTKDMGKSNDIIKRMVDGSLPFNAQINIGIVDIEDVSEMHLRAATYPKVDGKRFLLSERSLWLNDIAKILLKNGFKKAVVRVAPNFLVKLFSLVDAQVRMVVASLGKDKIFDCKLSKEVLKWKPTDVENAIVETARQYQELGKIK